MIQDFFVRVIAGVDGFISFFAIRLGLTFKGITFIAGRFATLGTASSVTLCFSIIFKSSLLSSCVVTISFSLIALAIYQDLYSAFIL